MVRSAVLNTVFLHANPFAFVVITMPDTADGTPGGGHDADEFVLVEKPEGAGSLELPMMAGEFGGGLDYPGQGGAGAGGAGQHGAAAAAHSEAMRLIVTRLEALGAWA